ncbi:MAG: hypothetical protein VB913_09935 [Rhodospirillales bacterium]
MLKHVRIHRRKSAGLDSFLHEYDLSTQEGVTLMCLAESLLTLTINTSAIGGNTQLLSRSEKN